MIDLLITDRKVSILHTEQIVSGNRNTYTVRYHFDQNSQVNWKHCMKVAVFASVSPIGAKKVRIAKLDAEDRCLIPQSILMHDAATVFAGVSGVYPNEDVVASQMCRIGAVDPGANGETFPMDEVPQSVMDSFLADVAELLAETSEKSHVHTNMDTLDRIGADGDKLTFDGVSVGGNDSRVDDLIYDVSSLQKTAHTHPNKPTLDRLTEVDGVLYLDGNRLGGVVVWHIVDDPVNVPSMDDGTLLFIAPGANGDMSYPPYKVLVLGAVVTRIAPWKPGQLWVCRGGVWFLIATANRTEYKPEEVITETVLPDGEVAAISTLTEADVSASAPTEEEIYDVDPCENVDKSGGIVEAVKTLQTEAHTHSNLEALERVEATDDVVLLPFGKPLDLYLRNDFQHLQYPQSIDGEDVGIFVSSTDGRHIILYVENHLISVEYYDGETTHRSNDGEIWSGGTIHPNEEPIKDFSIRRIDIWKGGYVPYDSVEEINSDNHAKYCFDVFCRAFNTSIENMGSIKLIENVFDGNYANGLKWGRNYYITVNDSTYVLNIDWTCPIPNGDFGLRNEAYCVVYLNLEQDCDIAHEAQYIVNGESPNTKAGLHKWIFNYLYDGTVSLGAIDLEAI